MLVHPNKFCINATTGNDRATGLPGDPLRTWACLERRLGFDDGMLRPAPLALGAGDLPMFRPLEIVLETTTPDDDPINAFFLLDQEISVHLHGTVETLVYTGTLTDVIARDTDANDPLIFEDTSLPGTWGDYYDCRIRFTDGDAEGAIFYVSADLGNKACMPSDPSLPAALDPLTGDAAWRWLAVATTPKLPAIGDSFVIERMTRHVPGRWGAHAAGLASVVAPQFVWGDLRLEGGFNDFNPRSSGCILSSYSARTKAFVVVSDGNWIDVNGHWAIGGVVVGGQQEAQLIGGLVGGVHEGETQVGVSSMGGVMLLTDDVMLVGGGAYGVGTVLHRASIFNVISNAFNPGGHAVRVGYSAQSPMVGGMTMRTPVGYGGPMRLWGKGNAGAGVYLEQACAFTAKPPPDTSLGISITGSGGDFQLAGNTNVRAWDESGGVWTSPMLATWANLNTPIGSGGLGGNAQDYATRTVLSVQSP